MSQAGQGSSKDVGSDHPSPELIPHSNPAKGTNDPAKGKESYVSRLVNLCRHLMHEAS
jgi:hypothetical protein